MPLDPLVPPGPHEPPAVAIGFEWRSFSGLVRLAGAEVLLPPGATFWGALVPEDRGPLREELARAVAARAPIELTVRLQTRGGIRPFVLRGMVVRGEPPASPRVAGVLLLSGAPP